MQYLVTFEDGSSGYLKHHGVKGMKWGVWNEDTRARRLGLRSDKVSTTEKNQLLSDRAKRNIKIGAAVVGGVLAVAGGVYLAKQLSGTWYGAATISARPLKDFVKNMDSSPVTLKKNSKIQRIAGSRTEDLTKKGELYVSYMMKDNAKYMDRMPREQWLQGNDAYKQTWKAVSDIKAPSRKEAAEIYLKVAGKDARQSDYMRFMEQGIRSKTPSNLRADYIKELKSRGYNALIDENDAVWTNKPLILIDPKDIVTLQSSRKINAFDKVVAVYLR